MSPAELQNWLMLQSALNYSGKDASKTEKLKALAMATAAQTLGEPKCWRFESVEPFRVFIFDMISEDSLLGVLKHANFPVELLLDSTGGPVPVAMALAKKFEQLNSTGTVVAACASSANFLLAGCRHRRAVRDAKFMFHKVTATVRGNAPELRSAADFLEKDLSQTLDFWCARTGMDTKKALELHSGPEIIFDAEQALAMNLIDEITDEAKLPQREIPRWPGMKCTLDATLALELGRALTGLDVASSDRKTLRNLLIPWLQAEILDGVPAAQFEGFHTCGDSALTAAAIG